MSTVLKLILGLYTPQLGRITIGDMNLRQIDPIVLRRSIAYAPQTNRLFFGTVAENLRLANPSVTAERMEEAAERAGILEEILALPEAFETRIDLATFDRFSKSFTARLSIARAIVRGCGIWLLDEPESALDGVQDSVLIDELHREKGSRTVVIATNNMAYLDCADTMIWLDRGRTRMIGAAEEMKAKYASYYAQ